MFSVSIGNVYMLPKSESLILYGAGPRGEAGKKLILVTLNTESIQLTAQNDCPCV